MPGGGFTYCYQFREYRGFYMVYTTTRVGPNQPVGAEAAAAMAKSQQLIDLRFPK